MPKDGDVEFDLRTTELATLGELRKRAREAHLQLLDDLDGEAVNRFVNVHRVMYHHLSAYTDNEYNDLESMIQEFSRKSFGSGVSLGEVEDLETMSSLVDDVINDTGFAIERETEFEPEEHAVAGLR